MTASPESNELAPSRDPAAYGAPRLLTPGFWLMIGFGALCLIGAVLWVILTPRFAARPLPAPAPPSVALAATSPPPAALQGPGPVAVPPILGLEDRLRRLEAGQARLNNAAAAALAASTLADATAGPRPFTEALNAASAPLAGSPHLRALYGLAAQGAPTRADLAAELANQSADALAAAERPAADAGFVAQLRYALSRVVMIRRVETPGPGVSADLTHARTLAAMGDLEAATAAIDKLPAQARAPLAAWRTAAQQRISIDSHVAGLRAEALAQLAAARMGPT